MIKEAKIEEKKVTTEGEPRICGIMYDHGDGNYSLGEGIALTKEEENTVQEIFEEHINEGCGYFGTKKDIAEQLLEVIGDEPGNKTLATTYNRITEEKDWHEPWMKKVCELCLEYLMLDGFMDATRERLIPDEIQDIVGKTLTHDDLDLFHENDD